MKTRHRKHWNQAETDFLKDNYATIPTDEIAARLGRTKKSVQCKAAALGLVKPRLDLWTEQEESYLRANNGVIPYDEMDLDRTPMAIWKHCEVLGLKTYGLRCPVCQIGFRAYNATMCRRCANRKHRARNGRGRYLNSQGYIELYIGYLPEEDWGLVYPMVTHKGGRVLEHRYVMAKHLGRPLDSAEVVHHLNGDRADNRIENLRLFRKGNHHQGSGEYYQRWQEALREIRRLQAILDECASSRTISQGPQSST